MPATRHFPIRINHLIRRALTAAASVMMIGCAQARHDALLSASTPQGEIHYTLHSPAEPATTRVILAHGFLRDPMTMAHLAAALAEGGSETASITLRRSKPWNGNHAGNARDMIALRKSLGWEKVIYAGFSAGALSSLLAAAEDSACTKLIMLDPVDHASLGIHAAPDVCVPALAIIGRHGPGNANRNASAMLRALPLGETIELPEATHCDFEANPSKLCHFLTKSSANAERTASVHATVILHAVAFISETPIKP